MSEDTANWMEGIDSTNKAKNTTIINFYDEDVLHPIKTKEAGRPIYVTKTFIHKLTPGDRLLDIRRPIRPLDIQEFPDQYERYQKKQKDQIEGTPLEEWPYLSKTRVAELHAINVFSVEHVAGLPDSVSHKIMDFHDLKKRAAAYLQTASDSSFSIKLQAELDEKEEKLKSQAKLISDLNQRLGALEKRKPGRPKGSGKRGPNAARAG